MGFFLFLAWCAIAGIGALVFLFGEFKEDEKRKRKYFYKWLIVSSLLTIYSFSSVCFGHDFFIFEWDLVIIPFWIFYIQTLVNLLMLFGENAKYRLLIIVVFAFFPTYLHFKEINHQNKFINICENDYEYKIHKKIQLPRQYFHVATKEEADERQRILNKYDYVPDDYVRVKEGDLVANYEDISLNDLLNNIREKKIFKQDRVYEVGVRHKKCGDKIKELENINLNQYGYFFCGNTKYSGYGFFEKRYSYDIYMNTDETLSYVNSFNYSSFGRLKRFMLSNKKIECSERPIGILSRDLVELKK